MPVWGQVQVSPRSEPAPPPPPHPRPAALPGKGKHLLFFFLCASLKILTLEERGEQGLESQEERQGKMLLHTEYSLLSLLHTQDGVVHHHGLFQVSGPHSLPCLVSGRAVL